MTFESTWASATARCNGVTKRSSKNFPARPSALRCARNSGKQRSRWRNRRAMWAQANQQAAPHFYLMEMNIRLQVEHPVTEMLTGLDLLTWPLRIARGEPLPLAQADVRLQGHAIEVRLCAEDKHFTPQTGTVQAFAEPEGLRFEHALNVGTVVTPHYDATLGKLIAHAPTRLKAIDQLRTGLDQTAVLELPTNRAFLAACLQHPLFRAGEALIPFLAEESDAVRQSLQATSEARTVAVLYSQQAPAAVMSRPFARSVRMGWHSSDTAQLRFDGVRVPQRYRLGDEGMGFMRGMVRERVYREVKVMTIGGGSEEIMKEPAVRQLGT